MPTLPPQIQSLQVRIQHNCHISDAQFAGEFSICIYLLKMREYFRWEHAFSLGANLPNDEVGNWLTEREQFWETLEEKPFLPLEIGSQQYDPFDTEAINAALNEHGLVYSAGYGSKATPHFFLARLEKQIDHKGYRIHVAAEEYARDLSAPPALSQHRQIFIRRESLRRMLWERLEEWRWNRPDNTMRHALQCYDFENDLETALEQMADVEIDSLILHEIGEVQAGELLGAAWQEMIHALPRSRLEIMARAVRDHLADALSTLPSLVEQGNLPAIHFYFANLSGMRKQIYPALMGAYRHWTTHNDNRQLKQQITMGRTHWLQVARELLQLHNSHIKSAWRDMESLIEAKLL
ncbi:hypothetical protein MNBD_GAMMA13-1445 [hydrothermal vent metagenome]|uniref:Uncharacterized protein n=1 Tax=hydrothermal vent metagenome TaxID=652676 RepID=A0A3B0ZMN8_9ZZZZ